MSLETVVRVRRANLPIDPSTGAPVPPVQVSPRHRYCWTDTTRDELVFTTSADDLCALWWPGYEDADYETRQRMRLDHAVATRTAMVAELVADATPGQLSEIQRAQMLLPANRLAELSGVVWTSAIPLVLIDGAFAPVTALSPPLSGIDGDVRLPSNIVWLRPRTADGYLRSLAQVGQVRLSMPASN